MADKCTTCSMLAEDLCTALRSWWFEIFKPPKVLLANQEERFGGDKPRKFLDAMSITIERNNALVKTLLHTIQRQTTSGRLPITNEDAAPEACYAKNNTLEIGRTHSITEVLWDQNHQFYSAPNQTRYQ